MGRVSGSHMFGYTRSQVESVKLTSYDVDSSAWDVPDDISAFVHYGTLGLNPVSLTQNAAVDAPAIVATTGMSYGRALFASTLGGFLIAGAVGWVIDPQHKRVGGFDETSVYDDIMYGWEISTPPWER